MSTKLFIILAVVQIHLTWLCPTNSFLATPTNPPAVIGDDLQFTIRQSPTLDTNPAAWPVAANLWASNTLSGALDGTGTNYICTAAVAVTPGTWFFVVQPTNLWTSNGPVSNIAATPPLPPTLVSNTISK